MEGVAGSPKFVRSGAGSPNPGARPGVQADRLELPRRAILVETAAADAGR